MREKHSCDLFTDLKNIFNHFVEKNFPIKAQKKLTGIENIAMYHDT
jgi:hypothetical protein